MKVTITIDDKQVTAQEGMTVFQAAQAGRFSRLESRAKQRFTPIRKSNSNYPAIRSGFIHAFAFMVSPLLPIIFRRKP